VIKPNQHCLRVAALVLFVGSLSFTHAQEADKRADDKESPLTLLMDFRLRYTNIEQGNKPLKADVTTLRFAPGVEVKLSPELTLKLELIHTDFIGPRRFNDATKNVPSPYPVLPDPRYTGHNQATLTWTPTADLQFIAGRQAVKIGNERHISNDNFRQIPQLFDGLLTHWTPFNNGTLLAGYFPQMRSRLGSEEQAKLGVFELALNPAKDLSTTLYAFRHQPEASLGNYFQYHVKDISNLTLGGTVDYSLALGPVRTMLNAEYARQTAIAGGSPEVAANYYRVGAGASLADWTVRADHENRASNAGRYGFQTVLSDYYAYNGNSLVFYAVPVDGLRDTWATLRYERGPFSMLHEYHWFRSDFGGKKYGRELDLNFTYNWTKQWYSRAQWAHYMKQDAGHVDVDKVWITFGYNLTH
jgi:hypothetical protein